MKNELHNKLAGAGSQYIWNSVMTDDRNERMSYLEASIALNMMRRNAENACELLDICNSEIENHRVIIKNLKGCCGLFYTSWIAELELNIGRLRDHANQMRNSLLQCGLLLIDFAPLFDENTTLNQRCKLLNVDIADRSTLTESDGLLNIIFVYGLEDSAARRGAIFNTGVMSRALNLIFHDFSECIRGAPMLVSQFTG
ncbi:hypothetical protein ACO0K2_09265 [Undibacterium sp. MH2W]|uniref:hypothetical protein n=1 Tax=Undibacterium sp. MH2W TaxID=3413044 RepID=UPI003BF2CB47